MRWHQGVADEYSVFDETDRRVCECDTPQHAVRIVADHNRYHQWTTEQIDAMLDEKHKQAFFELFYDKERNVKP